MNESSPPPCPFLPVPEREYTVEDMQALGKNRGSQFYETALKYAQTFWLRGFPAKALLLINRALSCHLPGVTLREPAQPYHAVAWVLLHTPAEKFMGNPRRHYQHLATRMVEPHKELRSWRAWACWYIAKHVLNPTDHPADAKQIREEGIVEPVHSLILANLQRLSPCDDDAAWQKALEWAAEESRKPLSQGVTALEIREIDATELPEVQSLAQRTWPVSYAGIISPEQIQHMLDQGYHPQHLEQEMTSRNVKFALLEFEGAAVGYLSWEALTEESAIFLHKLYVLPQMHDRGIGAQALDWLVRQVQPLHPATLRLRVNRNNHQAIRAYLRRGFVFESDVCTDIGDGYVMDDHVMVKPLR